MGTVTVIVRPECETLIGSLPRGRGWELISEDYDDDDYGEIVIGFEDDELTAADKRALDANLNIVSYKVN